MSEETPESIAETNGYLLGISVGWEQVADHLLDGACSLFRAGQDDLAQQARDFARDARKLAADKRREYEKHNKNGKEED